MTQADDATTPTTSGDSTSMISMTSVNKHFGELHVLQEVNLEVPKGQVVIVLGPSGSGKSTLCRTINRLEPIDSGTIAVDGKTLPEEGKALAALRADVGMVFQSFNLFAHKTILENVMLAPMKVRKAKKDEAKKTAQALLERVGIANQADKYPAQLSGGQQQRVRDCSRSCDAAEGDVVRRAHLRSRPRDGQRGSRRHDLPSPRKA